MFSLHFTVISFRRMFVTAAIALIVAIAATPCHGQAVRGTLVGNVTDSSGAAMPGVTVTITDVNTSVGRTAVSNESGNYTFSSLLSGTYRVEAELQGFRKYQREGVEVDVNTTVRVDIPLEVGQLSEQVTVTAETPALQTDRTDTGRIIEGKQVQEMPLAFNRNFQGILVTVPGATRPFRPHSQFFNSQDSLSTQVNGQSRLANNVQIEGLDNNHSTGLLTVLIPSAGRARDRQRHDEQLRRGVRPIGRCGDQRDPEIGHATISRAAPSSTATTRRPTRATTSPTSRRRQNFAQGGFTLGGPILRNKLFFFGDYQRTIDNLGYVFRGGSRRWRCAAVTSRRRRRRFTTPRPVRRTAPAARRSRATSSRRTASARLHGTFEHIPPPNIAGAALGQNNYQKSQVREKTTNGFDTKINYSLSASNQISGRFSFQRPEGSTRVCMAFTAGRPTPGSAASGTNDTVQHRGELDAHRPAADHGLTRRPQLLPQHRQLRGRGPDHRRRPRGSRVRTSTTGRPA